jgi:glycosyltransferase involved in cell wall biosynthesis
VVELPALPVTFYPGYETIARGLRIVNSEFRSNPFDVIHVQSPLMAGVIGLAISRAFKIPIVAHYHTILQEYLSHLTLGRFETGSKRALGPLSALYLRKFFSKASLAITPSKFAARKLEELGVPNVMIVPNCVDTQRFRPSIHQDSDGTKRILFVGRLSIEKRVERLLKAFEIIDSHSTELLIVGNGPHASGLKSLAADLELRNVRFLGEVADEDLPELYGKSSIFATASDTENVPVTILEAMASGIPTVAVKAGGVPEVVIEGLTGLIARPGDPKDFAQQLGRILSDDNLLMKLQSNCVSAAKEYSIESTCRRLEEVYRMAQVSWRANSLSNRLMGRVVRWA